MCISDEVLRMIVVGDVKNENLFEHLLDVSLFSFSPPDISFSRRGTALAFWFVLGNAKMNEGKPC